MERHVMTVMILSYSLPAQNAAEWMNSGASSAGGTGGRVPPAPYLCPPTPYVLSLLAPPKCRDWGGRWPLFGECGAIPRLALVPSLPLVVSSSRTGIFCH